MYNILLNIVKNTVFIGIVIGMYILLIFLKF